MGPGTSMELLLTALFLSIFLLSLVKRNHLRRLKARRLPPGPRNLPFIGSIHELLLRRQPAHHTLRDLSIVHGPIMLLRLGQIRKIVISSSEAAKEIMKTHDLAFASRPLTPSTKIICYGGQDIIFSPYGEYWRRMRRLCVLELLSAKRVLSFRSIMAEEISFLLRSIASSSGVMVDLSSMFASLNNDIMARAVIGGRSADQKIFLSALSDVIRLTLCFSAVDLFPSMPSLITLIAGYRLKRCWLKMDRILEGILRDHRVKKSMNAHGGETEEDLTDVLLRIQQDAGGLSDDHVKAVINDMLMAGSETSSTVMGWVMSELVRNPKIMEKAQSEVREAVKDTSSKCLIKEELMNGGLSYLSSVINEALRLHPPVPLLLPRENQEDCKVMGYAIPAGTTVMVNAWAIGRDPKNWSEPEEFRPERFDEEDEIEFSNKANFRFIPFGAGRRSCPGIHFGMSVVEMTIAHLLYYFDWKYMSANGEELDMTETFGVAIRRKSPLSLVATPRFPLLTM